jgi:hypothetical protein
VLPLHPDAPLPEVFCRPGRPLAELLDTTGGGKFSVGQKQKVPALVQEADTGPGGENPQEDRLHQLYTITDRYIMSIGIYPISLQRKRKRL